MRQRLGRRRQKNFIGNVGLPFFAAKLGSFVSALHPDTVYMKVGATIRGSTAMASEENWIRYAALLHFQEPQ